jgi:hypothetical protein
VVQRLKIEVTIAPVSACWRFDGFMRCLLASVKDGGGAELW